MSQQDARDDAPPTGGTHEETSPEHGGGAEQDRAVLGDAPDARRPDDDAAVVREIMLMREKTNCDIRKSAAATDDELRRINARSRAFINEMIWLTIIVVLVAVVAWRVGALTHHPRVFALAPLAMGSGGWAVKSVLAWLKGRSPSDT